MHIYHGCNLRRIVITASLLCLAASACFSVEEPPPEKPKEQAQPEKPVIPEKKSTWEHSAAAGLTLTRGNNDTILFTAKMLSLRKWGKNELSLGADGTYGEVENTKNAESLHGYGQYNRLFSERFFGYARLEGLHDSIADLEYRFTFSPGAGYYFLKSEATSLSGEIGPAVIHEKLGWEEKTYMSLRLAERFEQKLNKRARLWESFEILPQVDRFENFIFTAEIGIEASITTKLSLQTYVQDFYINEPAPGRKSNDFKLVSALAYKF